MKQNYKMALLIGTLFLSQNTQADAILHAFNWSYADVTTNADAIADAGYKAVLIAPPLKSSGSEWWARYQPQDYRVIDHALGNKQTLQTMIDTLAAKGVNVYADVVLNHMANESGTRSDLNYPGSTVLASYAASSSYYENQKLFGDLSNNLLSANDFHAEGCISNWSDTYNVQYYRICGSSDTGLPDLDPNNWVVSQQQAYLTALKSMGIKGFRIDAVKHLSSYQVNAVFTSSIISNMHVFGEVITYGGTGTTEYDTFLEPYLSSTTHGAYDFPLFATIRSAFAYGGSMSSLADPASYGLALSGSRAVTFVITHDIPNNSSFRSQIMDATDETLGYAYIFGRDGGSPMVYSDHNESGDSSRWVDAYKRSDIKAMIKFHNTVQGHGQQLIGSTDCLLLFKRDKAGIVGINKCSSDQDYWVNTSLYELDWNRTYRDVLDSSSTTTVTTQWHKITVPARSARMWIEE